MVVKYIFLFFIVGIYLYFSKVLVDKGFDNLRVYRNIDKKKIKQGDNFLITIIVENNKRLPATYLLIEEVIPFGLKFQNEVIAYKDGKNLMHISKFSIGGFKRKKRTYKLIGEKTGVYLIKNIKVSLGDVLATTISSKEMEDYLEVIVLPEIKDLGNFKFDITNFQGDKTVRRWIHKDPLYIKGIRDYTVEDRMKDIHWKSSLKNDKLMVKEYDFTSEQELIIIIDIQCGEPHWKFINEEIINRCKDVAISLAAKSLREGIPTGVWTNGHIISYSHKVKNQLVSSLGNLDKILEFITRIDLTIKYDLSDYLKNMIKSFEKNNTYVLVASYLSETDKALLISLAKMGYRIKIIYFGEVLIIPKLTGIEILHYRGER